MTKPYHVKIAPPLHRQLLELSPKHQKLIIKMAEMLAINPRPPGAKKVEGMNGLYSESINQHRIVYKIEDQDIFMLILKKNYDK